MTGLAWRLMDTWPARAPRSPQPVDYPAMLNPLRSVHEIRARVARTVRKAADAVSLYLESSHNWRRHRAGQHLMVGVEIGAARHSPCFSPSSGPTEGLLGVIAKRNGDGLISNCLISGRVVPGKAHLKL